MVCSNTAGTRQPLLSGTMLIKITIVLIIIEALFFMDAALLHAGIELFGRKESLVVSEALIQGLIGLFMFFSALGIWRNQKWSIGVALLLQLIALAGALFGSVVVRESDNNLNYLNSARLIIAVLVLTLLLLPKLKPTISAFKHST